MIRAAPTSASVKMNGHIIISVCNSLVETLAERFSLLKAPSLVIEWSESVAKSIYKNYPVLGGDPSFAEVLRRASISSARLIIANENDELNAEIILTLRDISDIETIVLVNDLTRFRPLRYTEASRIISPKTLLGTFIAQITSLPIRNVFSGSIQFFGDLFLVKLPIYLDTELIREKLEEIGTKNTGACIVGIWQRGVFHPQPRARGDHAL